MLCYPKMNPRIRKQILDHLHALTFKRFRRLAEHNTDGRLRIELTPIRRSTGCNLDQRRKHMGHSDLFSNPFFTVHAMRFLCVPDLRAVNLLIDPAAVYF